MADTIPHEPPFGSPAHAELVAGHRHPSIRDGLQWLTHTHLFVPLSTIAAPFYRAAVQLLWEISTDSPELTTTINQLIAARDTAIRAAIRHYTGRAGEAPPPLAVNPDVQTENRQLGGELAVTRLNRDGIARTLNAISEALDLAPGEHPLDAIHSLRAKAQENQ